MEFYRTRVKESAGTHYREVHQKARRLYEQIRNRTKRRSYVRSAYFKKQKIFLGLFWSHVYEKKNFWDQLRRLKFFPCAIELIQHCRFAPISKENPNRPSEILHRFNGITPTGNLFRIQIKEDKRSGQKWLISVYPVE